MKHEPGSTECDEEFEQWVRSLHPQHWARFDLTAARQGWQAHKNRTHPDEKFPDEPDPDFDTLARIAIGPPDV